MRILKKKKKKKGQEEALPRKRHTHNLAYNFRDFRGLREPLCGSHRSLRPQKDPALLGGETGNLWFVKD